MFYYYDPVTGEIQMRSSKVYPFTDLPYVQGNLGTQYSQYRVNLSTLQLEPKA